MEIAKLISFGKSDKEIASQLGISRHTVKTHKVNIYSKLGINKNTQLVVYALEQGIVS
jgi:DNA-binding NarL/FixJ family response regulator